MQEMLIYSICVVSLSLSILSVYMYIRLANKIKIIDMHIQQIYELLQILLQPAMNGGQQYVVTYEMEDEYEYEEEPDSRRKTFSKDDKVICFIRGCALEYDKELKEWVPKVSEDQKDNE